MQDFRNLSVWQSARRLTKTIYNLTRDFPASEEFGLKAQMRKASVSICANIAEGCGRRGDREFRRFLDVAMGSACELECETILSLDLAFITESIQKQILDLIGDLALVGHPIVAHAVVHRGGHALHTELATALLAERGAACVRLPDDSSDARSDGSRGMLIALRDAPQYW